jgi:hypothetical protein
LTILKTLTLLIFLRQALNRQSRRLWCESQDLLSAGNTNYHLRVLGLPRGPR